MQFPPSNVQILKTEAPSSKNGAVTRQSPNRCPRHSVTRPPSIVAPKKHNATRRRNYHRLRVCISPAPEMKRKKFDIGGAVGFDQTAIVMQGDRTVNNRPNRPAEVSSDDPHRGEFLRQS